MTQFSSLFAAPQDQPAATDWGDLLQGGVGIAIALLGALLVHAVLFRALRRWFAGTATEVDDALLRSVRQPMRLALCVLGVRIALPALELAPGTAEIVGQGLGIAVIVTVAWLLVMVLRALEWLVGRRYDMTVSDNLKARRVTTQIRILRRSLTVVVIFVAVAAILMTFPRVRQLGTSLLASAGIAGIVVGLAARPAVENLLAGLQLAFTEPIRLDDVVIIDGEWGRIEEITSTYVVVKIWDERRLVVPFTKFMNEAFQNWTRTSAQLLGTVFLHVDYRVPVDAVRAELQRVVAASEQWDRRVCSLSVTDATDRTVELRAIVSAADASAAFELRCRVREQLLGFLQREHPDCLPRVRAEVATVPAA